MSSGLTPLMQAAGGQGPGGSDECEPGGGGPSARGLYG